jgi:hypothetical protein
MLGGCAPVIIIDIFLKKIVSPQGGRRMFFFVISQKITSSITV